MANVWAIAGSPSYPSGSCTELEHVRCIVVEREGLSAEAINVHSLPSQVLGLGSDFYC